MTPASLDTPVERSRSSWSPHSSSVCKEYNLLSADQRRVRAALASEHTGLLVKQQNSYRNKIHVWREPQFKLLDGLSRSDSSFSRSAALQAVWARRI